MNGLETRENLNILLLGSYEVLTRMDCLESHRVIFNYLEKTFICEDDEGNTRIVRGIP